MSVSRVVENWEWRWVFISSGLLLVLLTIPFVWAYGVGAPQSKFMGVLVNPIDGASYQAKMFQGYAGSWLFKLPYTPEVHDGVYLFTFYLAMGHLARVSGIPAILVFHVVRLIGGGLMMLATYRLVADWTDDVTQRRITWGLAVLGAGFGWLALPFGHVAPDLLLLPEAFPFQAAYANPHFPWALTAILLIAHILVTQATSPEMGGPDLNAESAGLAAGSLLLVSASPFALLPLGIGYGVLLVWLWRQRRIVPWREIKWGAVVLIFGVPLAAYNAWAISGQNPAFAAWMAQNTTPSPPVWDYLIAFGPLLLLAGVGLWASVQVFDEGDALLIGWLAAGLVLLYAPLGLQRRFSMGLIYPLAIYGGRGLWRVLIPRFSRRRPGLGTAAAFVMFVPTTIVALVGPMIGSLQLAGTLHNNPYFVDNDELEVLKWLGGHARGELVLAAPDTSLFLPIYGLRVVYGHPYETLHATERRAEVLDFYRGEDCSVVDDEDVDYIIVGPRETSLIGPDEAMCPTGGEPVFRSASDQVTVYAVAGP